MSPPSRPAPSFVPRHQNGYLQMGAAFALLLLLALVGLFVLSLLTTWRWAATEVHATIETVGAVIALLPGALALYLHEDKPGETLGVSTVCGLTAMAIFNLFHAAVPAGNGFVWLHSLAILAGGACFATEWLPKLAVKRTYKTLTAVTLIAVCISLATIVAPDAMPRMLEAGEFTTAAIALNVTGGLLFIIGALRPLRKNWGMGMGGDQLVAAVALCLGLSGLLFPFSVLWSEIWWYWHFLSLLAFLLTALWFFGISESLISERRHVGAMLSALSENANAAIYAKDTEGQYLFVNRHWQSVFGVTSTTAIGHSNEELFPPSMAHALDRRDANVMHSLKAVEFEDDVANANGRRSFLSAKFPLLANDGKLFGICRYIFRHHGPHRSGGAARTARAL